MEAYGPVPSRRLGKSLGINNIPAKKCTYSCVYCQLGRTITMQVDRESFYTPQEVKKAVGEKVEAATRESNPIDYLSFVPDGEPTLEKNLGDQIDAIRSLGYKVAVISNGSLIWQKEVRNGIKRADWVSLKMDAATEEVWKKVDRPHRSLNLQEIQKGVEKFARTFDGHLSTETMLIDGVNDADQEGHKIASYLQKIEPDSSYIAIPTRPPAEDWVHPAGESKINKWFQIFNEKLNDVEYLIGYEGNEFSFSGDVKQDLLSITAVHPMKREGVEELLARADADWSVVEDLLEAEKIIKASYEDDDFFIRKLPNL